LVKTVQELPIPLCKWPDCYHLRYEQLDIVVIMMILYLKQGNYDQSISYYYRALELYKIHYNEHHPKIAQVVNNLGVALSMKVIRCYIVVNYVKKIIVKLGRPRECIKRSCEIVSMHL
jgi:tetratricopeptide (TPR) repeat protein